MNSPYYKKSGLPGLMGTHDKSSPTPFIGAVLAGLGKVALTVGRTVAKGAKNFAGKGGFVSKAVKQGKDFAKTSKGKAVIGGLYAGKRAADKQIQEVDNSVYSSGKGLSGGIGGMNFNNKRI
tara:strand:+ start:271 stop:636 length:366 start_codon:yes stop_codon:yes gene_type:complete